MELRIHFKTALMINTAFYKFWSKSEDMVFEIQREIKALGDELSVKGKILLAVEGVNGSVSGTCVNICEFQERLSSKYPELKDMEFKDNPTSGFDHKRLIVKVKSEIITIKGNVDVSQTAPYIDPKEFHRMLREQADIAIVDIRNNYEHDYGHFQNSIKVDTEVFSEFGEHIAAIKEKIAGRSVVTYCTGGVRCEKATVLLREAGVTDVYQLKGGILQYGIDVGQEFWDGKCFVFDKRKLIDIDPKLQGKHVSRCTICDLLAESFVNCKACAKKTTLCLNCKLRRKSCCSTLCFNNMAKQSVFNASPIDSVDES